mmetsp:Transcript_57685/g.128722  ORF Transcript_57685/g.128722 Transcript_57685/m.128722 type:complete len:84 (+) Transcript_57685:84-335(+)
MGHAMDFCATLRQIEDFFNGCRNECDQKCVIDNHEVEILQGPSLGTPNFAESFCPSGRADLCTPRVASGGYYYGGITSERSAR